MGKWDELLHSDTLEPYLQPKDKLNQKTWPNIQETEKGFIAYGRQYGKQIYLGLFPTIEEAIAAQSKFKYTGEKSLKQNDPISQLPDLLSYYHQSTPEGIKHSRLDNAVINCDNHNFPFPFPLPDTTK